MTPKLISTCLFLAVLTAQVARADVGDEATITVVDEGATPEDVVKVIELPDRAAATAAKATGSESPNNKDKSGASGRDFGQQVSEEARDKDVEKDVDKDVDKDLKDLARDEAKHQGKGNSHNDDPGGNRHGPPH
ncbi:MAG TPA: hypothetical protein VL379_08865 [Pseudomonadales bacterium]|nr:hypothetical protein [Pseudomonadales bacterium]